MGPIISLGIGIAFYSLIERRDKWYATFVLMWAMIFIFIAIPLNRISNDTARGLLLGLAFIICAFLPRFATKGYHIDVDSDKKAREPNLLVRVGIIDFVWILLMGGTLAFAGFARGVKPIKSPLLLAGSTVEYRRELLQITARLMEKTVDSVFLLGGILAVCMTILWAGAVWRSKADEAKEHYKKSTLAAIKMVVAFFIIIFSALVWVGVPLYHNMILLSESLN